ncbi:MAG: hypothetical protein KDE19_19360, partial [Caldilineaceae bacterium]|nr:hypothetical protein [Caldilineaceae bacterium]
MTVSRTPQPSAQDNPPIRNHTEDTPPATGRTISPALLIELGVLIAQRLAFGLLVLLAIIYVTFLGMAMADGTPLTTAGQDALTDTVAYLQRLWQGDLGMTHAATSRLNIQPVADHLGRLLGRSLGLLGVALLFAAVVGIYLGLRAALSRHTNRSLLLILVSLLGVSAPSFFVAIVLQYGATAWTRAVGSRLLPI